MRCLSGAATRLTSRPFWIRRVLDDEAGKRRFSGTFDADKPEPMIDTLTGNDALKVMKTAEGFSIGARR